MKDILGVSSLVQWETVLPRFAEVPLSAGDGTDRPVEVAVTIQRRFYCFYNDIAVYTQTIVDKKRYDKCKFCNKPTIVTSIDLSLKDT